MWRLRARLGEGLFTSPTKLLRRLALQTSLMQCVGNYKNIQRS
jgi:hypothetical protein